jgi:hypothetical protein
MMLSPLHKRLHEGVQQVCNALHVKMTVNC